MEIYIIRQIHMAELVYALDLGSSFYGFKSHYDTKHHRKAILWCFLF